MENVVLPAPEVPNPQKAERVKWNFAQFEEGIVMYGKRELHLEEISAQEAGLFRKYKIPSLLIKKNGKLYHTRIDRTSSFTSTPCHMCCDGTHDCRKLKATSEENGGCMKVVLFSREIEKIDCIVDGFETWGTPKDALIVWKCSAYQKEPPRNPKMLMKDYLRQL